MPSNRPYLSDKQENAWKVISDKVKYATKALEEAKLEVLLSSESAHAEKVLERLSSAEEILAGLAYLCHPQSEWMGGETSKTRAPHIYEAT